MPFSWHDDLLATSIVVSCNLSELRQEPKEIVMEPQLAHWLSFAQPDDPASLARGNGLQNLAHAHMHVHVAHAHAGACRNADAIATAHRLIHTYIHTYIYHYM